MDNAQAGSLEAAPARLGPFHLSAGTSRGNAATLLFGTFSTIGLVTFLSFVNPYLFHVLGIPTDQQGALSGLLVSLSEITVVLLGAGVGAWSDRVGRRPVLIAGLGIMALGFVVYPLAPSVAWLVALRLLYAVGMAAAIVMLSTSIAEYVAERSRGRWMGAVGVCNGLGVVVTATVLAKLPLVFASNGFSEVMALRLSFWVLALAVLLLAWLMRAGLRAPAQPAARARANPLRLTLRGVAIGRARPRVALGYLTAFAARSDLTVITTFLSLWIVQAGLAAGMSVSAATARAGMVFGISQAVGLLWSFGMGLVLDRLPRLAGVAIAFAAAAVGYLALGLVDDPLGGAMILAVIVAGLGEASAVVSAGTLIGQEAPAEDRGAVLGTFTLAGSSGQILLTVAGGQLFDVVGPHAPFVLMGAVNLLVFGAALAAWRRDARGRARAAVVEGA
ncbi:MAG: MFS transporter [Gammaproteobacteria bacterium]|nr:MAG: MFS transporter [Gammaproteobacteria bacterium]